MLWGVVQIGASADAVFKPWEGQKSPETWASAAILLRCELGVVGGRPEFLWNPGLMAGRLVILDMHIFDMLLSSLMNF